MPADKPRSPAFLALLGVIAGALVICVFVFVLNNVARTERPRPAASESQTPEASRPSAPNTTPPEDCAPTTTVTSSRQFQDALHEAGPGTVIFLAPGVYPGTFTASGHGTASEPIVVCGTTESILDGGAIDGGYVFHLDGASHWVLQGFAIRNGQKGVMADETTDSVIRALTVTGVGDEAIHLRNFSTDNLVVGNRIRDTGLRKPKFGEGVYVGTAESNWCDVTDCAPDRSDRNQVTGNDIANTTSESVDIKEGTTGGVLSDNTFDGSGIVAADSWVDVKGNNWVIDGNVGTNSPEDGFQTHEILDGWGTHNVFRNNTATVNGPGYGYALAPVRENIVECNNTASGAGEGASNVKCSSG